MRAHAFLILISLLFSKILLDNVTAWPGVIKSS